MDMFFKHRLKFGIMMNIRYIKHIAIYILSVFLLSSCYISPEIEEKIELEPQPKYLGCPEDFKVYSDYENHEIAQKLKELYKEDKDKLEKYTKVLYAQARLIEGLPIENPTEISNLVCEIMAK